MLLHASCAAACTCRAAHDWHLAARRAAPLCGAQRNWVNIAPGYCSVNTSVPPPSDFVNIKYPTDGGQASDTLQIISAGGTQAARARPAIRVG